MTAEGRAATASAVGVGVLLVAALFAWRRLVSPRTRGEDERTELEGPPDILTVNYEIQRLQAYHDRLLLLVNARGERDAESINAFTEAFLIHYRNILDFLASNGRDDDIKATDFVPGFTSELSPEKHRKRINKRLAHLSRARVDYPKEWHFAAMLKEIRAAWDEFVLALLASAAAEEE